MKWNNSIEALIQKIGEQAECYSILHRNSEKHYSYLNHFIAIPVIVLSTVCGSANFAFGKTDGDLPSMILGGISIATGIIQTIGTYFRFAQLAEAHKISYISYEKMYNMISAELALPREHRKDGNVMLDDIRQAIERLQEIAPPIPDKVITAFKKQYSEYADVSRPVICNGLNKVDINKETESIPAIIEQVASPVNVVITDAKPEVAPQAKSVRPPFK